VTKLPAQCRACLLDLDGVLTPTVDYHRRAWSRLFAAVLAGQPGVTPYSDADYYRLVDGRPRYDGVRAVLASRGLDRPTGSPDDPPSTATVCGLGNLKNRLFLDELSSRPLAPYPGSLRLVAALARDGVALAVVSGSKNARQVLASAGLSETFASVIDGEEAAALGLAGKPAPDTFLEAARRLGVPPAHCAVIEDSLGGVAAGRAGGFSPVIGVDRGVGRDALLAHGAEWVVTDLSELVADGGTE